MEKDNLLRSKRIYEKRLSEELQLKTISNTREHHYSANYREWLHKEIKAIDKKLKEIEGDMIDGY